MDKVGAILKRYERACTDRVNMAPTWRNLSDYIRPVKTQIGLESSADFREVPDQPRVQELFDTSGIEANLTYAAGCMSWMTPSETNWFAFESPSYLDDNEEVKRWYGQVTEETRTILARSNFYSQIHEVWLDDGAFGTSGMIIEEPEGELRFEALQIGDYAIIENKHREVDTIFRDFKLTARAAEQKFGRQNLHREMVKMLDAENSRGLDEKHEFIHVIMPRIDRDRIPGKIDSLNMPWASIYIDKKHKHVVREGGTWENPAAVHRHLLWSHSPYGFSPGMVTLPDARQLNIMQQLLDTLVEKQVSPPTLAPAGYEGEIDLRADGVTFFEDESSIPRFWQNPGNYLVGEDRTQFRKAQINRAFHVELFQALSAVPPGKEMTAAEVNARQRDRLTLFSPTFARKNTEINTPIMKRVFALLLRAGAFPEPPEELVEQLDDGTVSIPDPNIIYTSRLALQLRAIHNETYMRTMDLVSPLMQIAPNVMDHFDLDKIVRELARNEGMKEGWLRSPLEVEQIQQARFQSEQEAEEAAALQDEAEVASKLGQAGMIAGAA